MAASIILQCEIDGSPSPFEAAIFICSPLPFSRTIKHGIDSRSYFGVPTERTFPLERPTTVPAYLLPDEYFLRGDEDSEDSDESGSDLASITQGFVLKSSRRQDPEGGPFYNMFHPSIDHVRSPLPTAHVYGAKDSWRQHSMDLTQFFPQKQTLEHNGSHEIPQSASEDICDLIEELIIRAGIL